MGDNYEFIRQAKSIPERDIIAALSQPRGAIVQHRPGVPEISDWRRGTILGVPALIHTNHFKVNTPSTRFELHLYHLIISREEADASPDSTPNEIGKKVDKDVNHEVWEELCRTRKADWGDIYLTYDLVSRVCATSALPIPPIFRSTIVLGRRRFAVSLQKVGELQCSPGDWNLASDELIAALNTAVLALWVLMHCQLTAAN
jgi:hypothetical protein